jgi:tetratricopeptide (TPR) repeat protein
MSDKRKKPGKAKSGNSQASSVPQYHSHSRGPEPAAGAKVAGPWIWALLLLVTLTLFVFVQVRRHDFIGFDDPQYVTNNDHVNSGLTAGNLSWAFTSGYANNWHPLTWISHMADVTLFGMRPGPQHLTNVVIHLLNTLLLFVILWRLTGSPAPSTFVAVLFAIHPLHVESVVWISERKDVLSTFFWMLTIGAYVAYVRNRHWSRYCAVIALFALGLMAKPMLVTLPFVLLLLDFWPLNRISLSEPYISRIGHLFVEKLPLFALAALSSVVTVVVQRQGGNIAPLDEIPLHYRAYNAAVSYLAYIGKMFWPTRLAAFYPLFPSFSIVWFTCAVAALLAITALAVKLARRRPYILVGWLWYIGTLIPVIGLVQVGAQSRADRYTYIPLIGLFIAIAWGAAEFGSRHAQLKKVLPAVAASVILACAITARVQAQHWKDNLTLWTHSVEVGSRDYVAHTHLGATLWKDGKAQEAIAQYHEALRIKPDYVEAHYNLGIALAGQENFPEAISQYSEAIRLAPRYAEAHFGLASALAAQGRIDEAIAQLSETLRLRPDYAEAHNNLGFALLSKGQVDGAITQFSQALRYEPDHENAHYGIGLALEKKGRTDAAVREFSKALKINPNDAGARQRLRALQRVPR